MNSNTATTDSQETDFFDYQFNDPSITILLNYNPIHVSYAILFSFFEEQKGDLQISQVLNYLQQEQKKIIGKIYQLHLKAVESCVQNTIGSQQSLLAEQSQQSYDNVNTGESAMSHMSKSQELLRNLIKKEKTLIKQYVTKTIEKIKGSNSAKLATNDVSSPNNDLQNQKSTKSKYLNSQIQNKEKISQTQSYFNQNNQYGQQRVTPDGMIIINEANQLALNHLKRPNINDRSMGLKNEKRKNDQGRILVSGSSTITSGFFQRKTESLWNKDPLVNQHQFIQNNKKVGKVDSNLGFQNLQNFNWVRNNDLVQGNNNIQKNRPSTRDSFKDQNGIFGRVNLNGQRPRIEMSNSPGNEGSTTNIQSNGRPQTRSGGGRPTTSGLIGHVVIQENFRADGSQDLQLQQQLLEQNFNNGQFGPQIIKRPSTRGNQVLSQSLYDSFKRENSPVIPHIQQNNTQEQVAHGIKLETPQMQDDYKPSPQKVSKYDRNEFKRPVVIQGALKRGAKHTMESIEEEDENQLQNEKQKAIRNQNNEDSMTAFNTQSYISVTPTPPKSEARKGSQNNIQPQLGPNLPYNGLKQSNNKATLQRKNNALNSSVQGSASVVFANNNQQDPNRKTFYEQQNNSMIENNNTKTNFYKHGQNLNEYDFNSQHSTSQASGNVPGVLSNKRSPRMIENQSMPDQNIKNSSFYGRQRQNQFQKQHETQQTTQTAQNFPNPSNQQKFGLKTVSGGFFNNAQPNYQDDSAYIDNHDLQFPMNTSVIINPNQQNSQQIVDKQSQNSNRSDQANQLQQQQKIYQIIKNQQENISSSITRNNQTNQQNSIGINNYNSTNPTNTSTVNSNHRSISPIMVRIIIFKSFYLVQ
ncbi:UNKNOWN [Stylonychia lemnae]|uniref:Uncharacterized protein n=1 Tax=Stylonychia lemnae TaxID=5949 RepID=A0A077ZQB7_STYLE|nr:UNKNOWN [Stylonychia lemnae]|eukprot:CDW71595.1 UNKNOWN [Stylonychia lemnae]